MEPEPASLQGRAILLLRQQGMVRLSEFVAAGITASTISRMEKRGEVVRLGRGLYQLPDASIDANHELALAARMVPGGVICLVSALAFHELTDTIPSRVWVAIGKGPQANRGVARTADRAVCGGNATCWR